MSEHWQVLEYEGPGWQARLERDWLRLYASMPLRTVYDSHHAHRLYARHLMPASHRLRYFGLSDGERVRAICPLEATVDHGLGIPTAVLSTPYHFHHWPFSDIICPEDAARAAFIPELVRHLRGSGERRLLLLGPVPIRSQLWNGLRELRPYRYCAYVSHTAAVIDCRIRYEDLLAGLPGKFRREVLRKRRRLNALPEVQYTWASAEPELSQEFEHFLALEASGWKATAGNVIKFQPEVEAFYRGLLTLNDAGDHVTMLGISTDGHCIAAQFAVHTGQQLLEVKTAYDEAFTSVGPGQELMRAFLEHCCGDPSITILNMIAASRWLQDWQPQLVTMGRAYIALEGVESLAWIRALSVRYGSARPLLHRIREKVNSSRRVPAGHDQ